MQISPSFARLARTTALVLVSASGGSLLTGTAMAAYQPNMVSARSSLVQAINYLNSADPDKGGHRVNAINLCRQAISEINMGIHYSNHH